MKSIDASRTSKDQKEKKKRICIPWRIDDCVHIPNLVEKNQFPATRSTKVEHPIFHPPFSYYTFQSSSCSNRFCISF